MLRRRNRLSRSRDFERVYRVGRSVANRYVVLYYFPRSAEETAGDVPEPQDVRVGFSVSKRIGTAVERNKIKRSLREVFSVSEHQVKKGFDLVFIARTDLRTLLEEQGNEAVRAKMLEVLRKGNLLVPTEGEGR